MSNYTTQMDAARKGIITPEMERVSAYENFDVEELRELVANRSKFQPYVRRWF